MNPAQPNSSDPKQPLNDNKSVDNTGDILKPLGPRPPLSPENKGSAFQPIKPPGSGASPISNQNPFRLNEKVPPDKENDSQPVVYHLNQNPYGLPFSSRSLASLVIGVIFLGIVSAIATFIIVTSQQKSQNVPVEEVAQLPSATPLPTETPTPTVEISPTIVEEATPAPSLRVTPTLATGSIKTDTAFTSSKYGYSITYRQGWKMRNFGAVDSKTPEMIGFKMEVAPTSEENSSILIAAKSRTYQEEVDVVQGSKSSYTVGGVSGTKITFQTGKGISYTKVVIPLGNQALSFVARSGFDTEFTALLASYKSASALGESTGPANLETPGDEDNPYLKE